MAKELPKTSRESYGILITPDIRFHRQYFNEMVTMLGINVIFRSPKDLSTTYTTQGEFLARYNEPQIVGCIFNEHPDQKTTKKLGWVSELQENSSLIHVPYDLEGLQVGALFIIPSGLDNTEGRVFRVVKMSTIMIYPASVTCEIVPEYFDAFEPVQLDHSTDNFNLLVEGEDDDE